MDNKIADKLIQSKEMLIDYLKMLVNMESNKYLQSQLLNRLEVELAMARQPRETICEPRRPEMGRSKFATVVLSILIVIASAIAGAIGVFAFALGLFVISLGGVFFDIRSLGDALVLLPFIVTFLCVLVFLFCKAEIFQSVEDRENGNRQYKEDLAWYKSKVVEIEENEQKKREKEKFLVREIIFLKKQMATTKKNLEDMYGLDIIYEKYRKFIPICSICEYFEADRCKTLGDAYNMYESELRANIIIDQLNTIISYLDKIQKNQYRLYNEMRNSNRKMDQMISEIHNLSGKMSAIERSVEAQGKAVVGQLEQLNKMSVVSSYNEERIKTELEYMNRLTRWSGNNGKYNIWY